MWDGWKGYVWAVTGTIIICLGDREAEDLEEGMKGEIVGSILKNEDVNLQWSAIDG